MIPQGMPAVPCIAAVSGPSRTSPVESSAVHSSQMKTFSISRGEMPISSATEARRVEVMVEVDFNAIRSGPLRVQPMPVGKGMRVATRMHRPFGPSPAGKRA